MIGVSLRTIYRWVESQRLHVIETPAGLLLICLDSLREPGPRAGLTSEIFNDNELHHDEFRKRSASTAANNSKERLL
jgi:hypothetical protein